MRSVLKCEEIWSITVCSPIEVERLEGIVREIFAIAAGFKHRICTDSESILRNFQQYLATYRQKKEDRFVCDPL